MNKIRQAYKAGWWQNAQKPISDEHIIAMEAWEQADWDVYVILNNIPKNDWQPIETAPDDRLILLGLFPHPGFIEMPRKVGGWWDDKWNIFGGSWTPTHWVELPEPLHE